MCSNFLLLHFSPLQPFGPLPHKDNPGNILEVMVCTLFTLDYGRKSLSSLYKVEMSVLWLSME